MTGSTHPHWFLPPEGNTPEWREAVREVAELTGDLEALTWHRMQTRFWELMHQAGLIKGVPKPPPERREALFAELDQLMGIS